MSDPHREYPNTYFVPKRSHENELARLQIQDQVVTAGMGGVLPEQQDPASFQQILDVGCGTGGWLIELARQYPMISLLVGVDVNRQTIEHARMQAEAQQVSDRVQFREMDVLGKLDFPTDYFALVNQRFGASFLRTWEWPHFLYECQRVCKPGGVIRITEADMAGQSTSPALSHLFAMMIEAFYRAGHLFTPEGTGMTGQLTHLLHQARLQNVQTRLSLHEYRAGTLEWQSFYEDMRHLFRGIVPFLRKWTHVTEDYEAMYQQALAEMQQPDFVARVGALTAWGNKPLARDSSSENEEDET